MEAQTISLAARRTLYDRFFTCIGTKSWWFGNVTNSECRELVAAGMVDDAWQGIGNLWVITREGWEMAESIHAETIRLRNGVPFAEYKSQRSVPLDKKGWISDGKWHTNGYLCALGAALNTQVPEVPRLTAERFERERVVPRMERVEALPVVVEIGTSKGRATLVWFSNGRALNGEYYSHVMRLFPRGEWRQAGNMDAFCRVAGGRVVGVVMPWNDEAPAGIAALIGGAHETPEPPYACPNCEREYMEMPECCPCGERGGATTS